LKIKKILSDSKISFAEIKYFTSICENYIFHSHSDLCICIIEEGAIKIQYTDCEEYIKNEKDIFIFNPNQIHKTKNINSKGYYILFLNNKWCNENKNYNEFYELDHTISFNKKTSEDFLNICKKIIFEKSRNNDEKTLKLFIKKLFKNYSKYTSNNLLKNSITISAEEYIYSNLNEKLTTNKIARYLGYDKSYFIRTFKIQTGMTPNNYVINRKIEKVKNLLIDSEVTSIASIAHEVGFYDQSHLNRNFKKIYGVCPNKYIKINNIINI
jgi:AraC-like DNA-binding protein